MQKRVITALIIMAVIVTAISSSSIVVVTAANVTWDFSNDVLVSYANEDKQQRESHIAVSANNNNYLVTALMDNTPDPTPNDNDPISKCRVYNSTNAGNSWTDRGFLPLPSGTDRSNDPVVASTTDGKFFVACIAGTSSSTPYLLYWRSTDNGATWSSSPNIIKYTTDRNVDKPWIAADIKDANSQYRNNVYVCWQESIGRSNWITFKKILPSAGSEVILDTPPSSSSDPTPLRNFCHIVVGKNGIIYVIWARYNDVINTTGYIMMRRSFDGGATWFPSLNNPPYNIAQFIYVPSISSYTINGTTTSTPIFPNPQLAVDNNWDLHLVYVSKTSTSASDTDVMYRKITNCVSTSSCNISGELNVSNNSKDQWEPAITVSTKSNTVHITALDKRDNTENKAWKLWHYHCHLSTDTSSCTNISEWYYARVTDQVTYIFSTTQQFIGHYHGIATSAIVNTSAREAYTVWTDSRLYNNNQDYNIFYDRLT
ncbi:MULTISPECIES: sialidase family protein [Candidatus Nitrosocaldus]|jgi:hypothetical protein|uniref:Sialidase domain-containing protein n=1 Tax=Candidatus Nitrosocaldus cavascurensis TaxID=2058097 RepID=A0A2K5ARI1_9ARCH|nr:MULTISPECIES: sialidase family protein [Candidatus Nitrosocaldus]SPC34209.1 exported protein of unknown function [Candidatus Nitrosocaldus cavascurensis]